MRHKTNFIPILLTIIALGAIIVAGNQAFAKYEPKSRNLCTLMVKPYEPSAANDITGSTGNQYINYLSDQECQARLKPYPKGYTPQPPQDQNTPIKQGAEDKRLPVTKHIHIYYNDSVQDEYYYKSFVDRFEITIQPDAWDKIDFQNGIWCDTPGPAGYSGQGTSGFFACDGINNDIWGGTKITKKIDNTKKTVTVTWQFAATPNSNGDKLGRPWVWGNNGSSFTVYDANGNPTQINTVPDYARQLPFSVNLHTKDGGQIWSATTTSKVLLADLQINKNNYTNHYADGCVQNNPNNPNSGWCYLNPIAGFTTFPVETLKNQFRTYYWYNIGSVGTVWKKPPPEEEPSFCTGLKLTAPGDLKPLGGNMYEYVPQKGATFNVLPSFSKGPVPLDYRWHAKEFKINWGGMGTGSSPESSKVQLPGGNTPVQANLARLLFADSVSSQITQSAGGITNNLIPYIVDYGKFYDSITHYQTNPSSGKNPYVDTEFFLQPDDRSTYYTGGPEGTLITVQGVDPSAPDVYAPEAYVGNDCQAMIIIPKQVEENTCIDLDISPDKAEPLTPVTFTVTPKFQDQTKPFPLDYYWTANSQGDFNKLPFSPQESNSNFTPIDPSLIPQMGQTNLLGQLPVQTNIPTPPGPSQSPIGQLEATPIPLLPSGSSTLPGFNLDFNKVPFPGTGGIIPKILGLFEDSLGAGDLANPYWEKTDKMTHYTGGTAGTWISVQAYGKDGTLYPACKASLQIPPDQENPEQCLEARIVRGTNGVDVGAEVQLEDPINGLWVQVATDPQEYGDDLSFDWEVNGTGELYSTPSNFGTRVTTTNFADTVNLNGAADGTRVTVQAIDPENKLENIAICNDSFVVKDSGEQPICRNLGLTNTNPNLQAGGSTRLNAAPVRDDGTPITVVRWSENGEGRFILGPSGILLNISVPGYCPQPPANQANQSFTAPAECEYIYYAGPNGGDSFRVEAAPHDGVIDCMYQYTVPRTPPPGKPYCVNLDLVPNSINRGTRTNYNGSAFFSDGKVYNVDVAWSGQNGTFSNNSTFELRQNVPPSGFANYFNHSSANSSGRVEAAVKKAYGDVSQDFRLCSEVIQIQGREDKEECTYLYLRWPYDGLVCIGTDHEGNFIWGKNDTEWTSNELCIPATRKDTITVEAVGYKEICSDEYSPDEDTEYKLRKEVNVKNNNADGFTTRIQTIPQDPTTVWYRLIFTPLSTTDSTTVTITDDISKGFLTAMILPVDAEGKPSPGTITYAKELTVTEAGRNLPKCSDLDEDEEPEHCYNGEIGTGRGIELVGIKDEVTIGYKATVASGLTDDICRDGKVCQEKYRNSARANVTEVDGKSVNIPTIRSNDIEIQIFCQYILTQAAGDIFLERDLSYGIDIQQCSEISSSPGIVITPGLPKVPELGETGAGDTEIFTVSHELCTAGLAGTLPAELLSIYGQDVVPRLSGQICEVRLPTGEAWKQTFITNSIDENKTRLSRWGADDIGNQTINSFQDPRIQDNSVYHIQGGNLTMATIDALNDGDGAKTFIIEDGDLIIKKNITYGNCPDAKCTVRDTASLAFIVLNGSVYIDPAVTEIAGVFFVQEGDKSADGFRQKSGRFFSGTPAKFDQNSDKTLKVTGSIYGDIDPLFGNRRYAGDPIEGGGGVVIRFDQRIILNTPPGLRDVLNLTQTEVAR